MRIFFISIAIPIFLSACSQLGEPDGDLLQALTDCPESETSCVRMKANLKDFDRTFLISVGNPPAVISIDATVASGDYGKIVISVTGRLNEGAQRQYRLQLSFPDDMLGCNDFALAALCAREGGGGVIVTEQGILDIESAEIEIGSWSTFGIIDGNREGISFSVAPGWERYRWDASPTVTDNGTVNWRVGEFCLNFGMGNRFAVVPNTDCTERTLSRATEGEVTMVESTTSVGGDYAKSRLAYDLWRAEGTANLFYIWGVACT